MVVCACAASAGAHAGLVPAHLSTEPRLGIAFLVTVVLLVAVAAALAVRPGGRRITSAAALLLAGPILAYVTSRTGGIPLLDPDPEAVDPVGIAATVVEAIGLGFALWLAQPAARRRRPPHLQEVSR